MGRDAPTVSTGLCLKPSRSFRDRISLCSALSYSTLGNAVCRRDPWSYQPEGRSHDPHQYRSRDRRPDRGG